MALPPQPKVLLHAEGRFTVLSYNILADLYATVRRSRDDLRHIMRLSWLRPPAASLLCTGPSM